MRWQSVLKLIALAVVWTFTAGADSCSATTKSDPTFVADLVLKNAAGAVRQEFAPGDPITMELTVRNRSNTEAILQFATNQQFDFVVVDSGTSRTRWLWSFGKAFLQGTTELEFAPNQTRTFVVTWDQLDNARLPVSVGNYEARGVLLFAEFAFNPLAPSQLGSPVRVFTIR